MLNAFISCLEISNMSERSKLTGNGKDKLWNVKCQPNLNEHVSFNYKDVYVNQCV